VVGTAQAHQAMRHAGLAQPPRQVERLVDRDDLVEGAVGEIGRRGTRADGGDGGHDPVAVRDRGRRTADKPRDQRWELERLLCPASAAIPRPTPPAAVTTKDNSVSATPAKESGSLGPGTAISSPPARQHPANPSATNGSSSGGTRRPRRRPRTPSRLPDPGGRASDSTCAHCAGLDCPHDSRSRVTQLPRTGEFSGEHRQHDPIGEREDGMAPS
jgi:hypothetical protein